VEGVKLFWIAALCLIAFDVSAAETVVIKEAPICGSTQHPVSAEQLRTEVLETLAGNAPNVQLKEFRGIVRDNEVAIQRLTIEVLLKEDIEKEIVAKTLSNDLVQFTLPLDRGADLAIFTCPGFESYAIAFEPGNKGWPGVKIAVKVAGSPVLRIAATRAESGSLNIARSYD
jgi:hypothetical protein